MEKMLFLGGFPQMIDIVYTARKMGIYTIVADYDENSPAKSLSDEAINISTNDIDGLEKICLEKNVDGIFTGFEDFNIHNAQQLCQRLGLPFYATKEQLEIITNKNNFKTWCRKYGVPVIEQYTLDEAQTLGKYPYIVKPADSYGSRGITICENEEQLVRGYEKAVTVSPSETTVIERFITTSYGTELFYTIVNGKIYLTATADRYTQNMAKGTVPLPVAEVFPSKHRGEMINSIDGNIRKMLEGMGIKNGLVLIQALYEKGEFFVYEMAYRFTGEQHYKLVSEQQNINLGKFMINLALGEDVTEFETELLSDEYFTKPSINLALLLKPGKIKKISGIEKLDEMGEIISYILVHKEGESIELTGDYSHIFVRFNMVAKDVEALKLAILKINKYICVTDENDENMIVTPFVLED